MKIGILGHFGEGLLLLNGQTIKTNNLVEGIKKYTDIEIIKIDTSGWIKKPFDLFKNIKKAFHKCDAIIMLPAQNGIRVFAPILLHYKKKYNKMICYDVVGGWLPEFLNDKKRLSNTLMAFDSIWVETNSMRNKLLNKGFHNVSVVPNFKELKILTEDKLVYATRVPYRLCTFSRVMKEKGIEDAVDVVKSVNKQLGYVAYSLDIYGQVWAESKEWFDKLQQNFPDYVSYKGVVAADKSVEVLQNYFALLFPTYYEGEGFAGTLIDAYSAGIPVIATDWRYNPELVTEKTGFIYKTGDQDTLVKILISIIENPSLILDKKISCIKEANKYSIDKAIQILLKEMGKVMQNYEK